MGDACALEEDTAGAAHRLGERRGPDVLPYKKGGRRVGLEAPGGELDVVGADQATDIAVQCGEALGDIELVHLERRNGTVRILPDEDEIEDANRPRLDQGNQLRGDLAIALVAGKPHDDVFDRSCGHLFTSLPRCTFRVRVAVLLVLTPMG